MMRFVMALILEAVFLGQSMIAQMQSVQPDSLSLERAIALALEHHPSMRAAEANTRSAASGVTQALSTYYPSLVASGGFTRTDGVFVFNPSIPPRGQTYNSYTTGLQFQGNIFDFGKTIEHVSASNEFLDAANADSRSTRDEVILNVQLAYFGLVQAEQVAIVNQEAVDQSEQHLKQAKANYTVGKRPQFDVTKAEVDLANANVNLIRAVNQTRLSKLGLENAMGVRSTGEYRVQHGFDVEPMNMSLDSIRSVTMVQRPELIAARSRVEANVSLASAAWDQHLPTLSYTSGWTWSNFDYTPLFRRWTAGLTVSLPVFEGFAISAQVEQARANADVARANLELLNESVMLEVEQSFLGLKEADEQISASSKLLEQAEENLNLAERQYAAGVGTELDVSDAQLSLSNARITKIQSLYDYNAALVRLKRSMGNAGK
ncbi:MAG: TolC family protein [Bacteroidota bacterium]